MSQLILNRLNFYFKTQVQKVKGKVTNVQYAKKDNALCWYICLLNKERYVLVMYQYMFNAPLVPRCRLRIFYLGLLVELMVMLLCITRWILLVFVINITCSWVHLYEVCYCNTFQNFNLRKSKARLEMNLSSFEFIILPL